MGSSAGMCRSGDREVREERAVNRPRRGRTTFWINWLLSVVLHAVAEAVKALPQPLVAVLAGLFATALSLELITLR